jgi:hypothetical protein
MPYSLPARKFHVTYIIFDYSSLLHINVFIHVDQLIIPLQIMNVLRSSLGFYVEIRYDFKSVKLTLVLLKYNFKYEVPIRLQKRLNSCNRILVYSIIIMHFININ